MQGCYNLQESLCSALLLEYRPLNQTLNGGMLAM